MACPHTDVRFETVNIQPSTSAISLPLPPFQRTVCALCGAVRLATGQWKMPLTPTAPLPTNPGQTHYEGGERAPGHHGCAIAKLDAAEAARDDRLEPIKYRVHGIPSRIRHAAEMGIYVEIEQRLQRDRSKLWAVTDNGLVLNNSGTWEYESIPSSRTDAFLARTRFKSVREAMDALAAARAQP